MRMLDFGQFDFGQFDFGQLAEIELAEVEIGRSRNCPVETDRADGARTRQPGTPNVHISGPRRFKHHQNSTRRTPKREKEERTNCSAGRGKKRAKFWAVRRRAVPGRAVPGRAVLGRAVLGRAVPGRAVPGRAVPGRAVPGAPNMTKPKL